jgi:ABC-type nitrate/sulfonate/bicarbonate transport system substrate-binding protein/outer membrane protein OmpA-like peptidoglycan-associated protein
MKKGLIGGLLILAIALVALSGCRPQLAASASHAVGVGGVLKYATPAPVTLPQVGPYKLGTVDLGDGPVPLLIQPLDEWGGYGALFAANQGLEPNKNSLFYKYGHFAMKIVHIEDATEQLKGFASGEYPIIWTQMDGMPLLLDAALKTDKRVIPKFVGLFDWSNGGDGILVRSNIKTGADLKGKTILASSNTPYAFMLLWYLAQNGLTGNDVKVVWIPDGPTALQVFKDHPAGGIGIGKEEIAAWVTWDPFINDCLDQKSKSYVPDTRLIISSKDANQVIADGYMVRSDLLTDHPQMIQAYVEAMAAGSQMIGQKTYEDMYNFYKGPDSDIKSAADAKAMFDDVHIANFPEMKMFFDPSNTIGAYKIFNLSQEYYKELGALGADASYDPERVLTPKIIAVLDKTGEFASQKNEMANSFKKKADLDIADLESSKVVLTNTMQLYFGAQEITFDPNSANPAIQDNMKLLAQVAEQTKFLGSTVVKLDGFLDTSKVAEYKDPKKHKEPSEFIEAAAAAKAVSKQRADFIKSILVNKYKVSPDRIYTSGKGWDNPISTTEPEKNRRVEVRFISLE